MSTEVPRISSERRLLAVFISLIGFLAVLAYPNEHTASAQAASSPKVKRGDAIFHKNCVGCHNKQEGDNSPFGPPNLHGILRTKVITPAGATQIVIHGKGGMPPFRGTLSNSEIDSVIAYLKTL